LVYFGGGAAVIMPVLAFTRPLEPSLWLDPEFVSSYLPKGRSVKVEKGKTARAEVVAISAP
jgi:hypothetical protein